MDVYQGAFPDPALYDRFLKIEFKPTVPEWLAYAGKIGVHKAITQYISKITADLMPENVEQGKICPSPRSWVSLSDCIKYMATNGDDPLEDLDYFHLMAKGYLGETITVNFVEYVRKNYKVFSGEDILTKWDEHMEMEFSQMLVPELGFYHKEIMKFVSKKKKLTPKQSENLLKFVKIIPKESASGFWSLFTSEARDIATAWYNGTDGAKDYIFGFLSKSKALEK
jgi:hypothetical protein